MGNISVVGIDIAKSKFHFCGMNKQGRVIFRKRFYRTQVMEFVAKLPSCTIVMEACGGANYWGREFVKLDQRVKLIAPQFVKPYVKSNKNDWKDAEAICEAALRPTMRFVLIKAVEQQDVQSIHRVRQRLIKSRTAISNEIRGLLLEYGVAIPKGISHVRKHLLETLEKQQEKLTEMIGELIEQLYQEFHSVEKRLAKLNRKLEQISKSHPLCKRFEAVEGIGPVISTAVMSFVSNPHSFKNGRGLSAYFGIVPRHDGTGGKIKLKGISKRGDKYIRQLLIHGARSVVRVAKNKKDARSRWIQRLLDRKDFNRTCVAVANKNCRILWSLMANDQEYKPAV